MKRLHGVAVLLDALDTVTDNHWVYTNVDGWARQPENAVFYLIAEDELDELEEAGRTVQNSAGETIPQALAEEDVETWLDVQTLRAISQVVRKHDMAAGSDVLIQAINHYREYDDFMEA
ncbi:hypothetical protein JR065_15315 [Xanthomonas sp. AmX2]|uniref:DUF7716 domain-containing protein n=1 Tax=Xanthomonas sp. TaxID=29446 RepID=UPI00197E9DAE|nr:hypothetical protein [Xanthomonas sp.]MBN6151714.1 hypothetical protein [Xanthomonas sp.]